MNALIEEILRKKESAEVIVANCDKAIEAIQELCTHLYVCSGHGHNKTYYKCTECGKEDWE